MRAIAFALAASGLALTACGGGGQVPAISASDKVMGDPSAPVEVIEYASAACSHCATFAEEVLPEFKAKYIDTGQARYAVRELLTEPAAYAAAGFLLARCAGDERYFAVLDAVYRGQAQLREMSDLRPTLLGVAMAAGMSETEFSQCISDEAATKALDERVKENSETMTKALGPSWGTPIFFINGEQPFTGSPTMAAMDEAMQKALAE